VKDEIDFPEAGEDPKSLHLGFLASLPDYGFGFYLLCNQSSTLVLVERVVI
jgi:hypothetical protein